jgi:hypothetical protein
MRRLITFVAALALTAAVPSSLLRAAQSGATSTADASTPAGKWTTTLETPHGTFAMTFDLTLDGDKVGGTMTSDATGVAAIKGTFTDGKVAITADVAQGIDFHFTFKDQDTMTGNLSSQMGDMAVVAKRVKK